MKKQIIVIIALLFTQNIYALNCNHPLSPNSYEFLHCSFACKEGTECDRFTRSLQRDSKNGCRPLPQSVAEMDRYFPWLKKNIKSVSGNVFYADLIPGRYGYFIYSRNNELVIHSRVHFTNFSKLSDFFKNQLQDRFDQAAYIWRRNNPFPFSVKFIFEITENKELAHIKGSTLKSKTNGPYFKNWNINWSPTTIAHEFGHVLGLDDEYSYLINSALQISVYDNICEPTSFMCKSYGVDTKIKNYHYYMVFRRLFCS